MTEFGTDQRITCQVKCADCARFGAAALRWVPACLFLAAALPKLQLRRCHQAARLWMTVAQMARRKLLRRRSERKVTVGLATGWNAKDVLSLCGGW